jgi:hypothetical protein
MSQLEVGGIVIGVTLVGMFIFYKLTESTDYLADARTLDEQRIANARHYGGTRRIRGLKRSKRK